MRYDIQCNMIRCDTIMIGIVIRYDIWYIYPYVYASKLGYCTSCTSLYYDLQHILHIPYIWASSPQPICIYSSGYLNGLDALKPNMAQVGWGCRHFCTSSRTTGLWPCGTDFPNRSAHQYLEPTVIVFGDCRNIAYERRKLSYTIRILCCCRSTTTFCCFCSLLCTSFPTVLPIIFFHWLQPSYLYRVG